MKNSITNLILMALYSIFLISCAGTDTRTNEDSSKRKYDINASNNTGTIYFGLDYKKDERKLGETNSKGGTISPQTDLAAALSQGGSTTSLVEEGGKAILDNVSSMYRYLKEKMIDNPIINSKKPDFIPEKPEIPETIISEQLDYHGRYNGDRATFYGNKKMFDYPKTFIIDVLNCYKWSVNDNNGERIETPNGYLVKQSDVDGRGITIVASSECKSKQATISYLNN